MQANPTLPGTWGGLRVKDVVPLMSPNTLILHHQYVEFCSHLCLFEARTKKQVPSFFSMSKFDFQVMNTFSRLKTEDDLHSFTKMPSYSGIKAKNLLKESSATCFVEEGKIIIRF